MIKVIASDMDGTLVRNDHRISERTINAIKDAQKAGIRFMISTGRSFEQALQTMEATGSTCDYIVNSGAEIRNPQKEILQSGCMDRKDIRDVYDVFKEYDLLCMFVGENMDYCIGSKEEKEQRLIQHIYTFNQNMTEAEIRETEFFHSMMDKTRAFSSFDEMEASGVKIIKMFAMSNDLEMLREIDERLQKNSNLAVASSFENNLEITDVKAQKGIALKAYIESLGYTMDEVMVFGDSMNDYSMLSMDFGATIAMENGAKRAKEAAKYVTRSNEEDGVAYVIEELLKSMQ